MELLIKNGMITSYKKATQNILKYIAIYHGFVLEVAIMLNMFLLCHDRKRLLVLKEKYFAMLRLIQTTRIRRIDVAKVFCALKNVLSCPKRT